jgi:hypothetical protein
MSLTATFDQVLSRIIVQYLPTKFDVYKFEYRLKSALVVEYALD